MDNRSSRPRPWIGLVDLHVTGLVPDEFRVVAKFGARCLSVLRIRKVGVVGMSYPVFDATVKRALVVDGNVHVTIPRCDLDPERSIGRLRFSSWVSVGLTKVIRYRVVDVL